MVSAPRKTTALFCRSEAESVTAGAIDYRFRRWPLVLMLCMVGGLLSCARTIPPSKPPKAVPRPVPEIRAKVGMASWYGPGFHGKATTSGETYNMYQLTAAHPTLPMGTVVQVANLENHRVVQVRINDRGPFTKGRIIDLSYAAAGVLDMVDQGTAWVRLEIVRRPDSGSTTTISLKPHYELQLGAFVRKENALALQEDLEDVLGADAVQVVPARLGSQDIFRVRVGRYEQREDAEERALELARLGYVVLVVEEYE